MDEFKIEDKNEFKLESDYTPKPEDGVYGLGLSKDPIDANVALRNLQSYTPKISHTSRGSGGTGSQAITGVGFRPSSVEIEAVLPGTDGSWSSGHYTADDQFVEYNHLNVTNFNTSTDTSNIIWVKIDTGGGVNEGKANLTSLDDDGFTLNWSVSSGTVIFRYRCNR